MQYESIAEVANKLIALIKNAGLLHFEHGKHRKMLTVWHAAQIPLAQDARTATLKECKRAEVVQPPQGLPELPEPAVLIMMLLGRCVIGYRARRDSEKTFR